MSIESVTVNATAGDVWSNWGLFRNKFNLSISGTWSATVTLQRKFGKNSTTYLDVDTFVANTELIAEEPEDEVYYRIGVDSTDWTSGTVVGRLSQ